MSDLLKRIMDLEDAYLELKERQEKIKKEKTEDFLKNHCGNIRDKNIVSALFDLKKSINQIDGYELEAQIDWIIGLFLIENIEIRKDGRAV